MNSMRSRRVAATAGIVVAAFCVAGLVGAFWSAGSGPGGNGHALAGRLPTGAVPSALSRIPGSHRDLGAVDRHRARFSDSSPEADTPSRAMRRARSRLRSFPAPRAPER